MSGVYVSFPFCAQKCSFCNFASGVFPAELESEYSRALEAEIRAQAWEWIPDTVYFGGGTPSLMDQETLGRLLDAIPGWPWLEATLEAAPGSLTREKARCWHKLGITRVSLGVQSFVKQELASTGRRHDAEIVQSEVALLRECGIDNINIDLIAGLPYQTKDSWRISLDWIERLQPPHVSVYLFEIDEDSRLGLEILNSGHRYGADRTPSDDLAAELYETAVERLDAIGIERYEISNFARSGTESHHNLKYWRLEPYVGFGADAHSFDGRKRYANVESAAGYVQQWRDGRSVQASVCDATVDEERFFLGLRLMRGVEPSMNEWTRFEAPIQRSIEAGLLEREGAMVRLTQRGVLLSNEVFQEFITA